MPTTSDITRETLDNPFVRTELNREAVRLAEMKREAARSGGVHFGGMEAQPVQARTLAEIFAAAEAAKTRAGGPRAVFLRALSELEQLGFHEADTVRSLYWRSMADDRRLVEAEPALRAVRILNTIDHSTAREAIHALCDFAAPLMKAA